MLEMSERESSDVRRNQQPAHKAPGRVEAKEPRSRKSVYRSNSGTLTGGLTVSNSGTLTGGLTVSSSGTLTGGLTAFSRRPVFAEFRCVRGDAHVAVQKTKRHVNQLLHSGAGDLTANNDHVVAEYHTVMLEIPVYHAVAECSERKTDPMFSLRVD